MRLCRSGSSLGNSSAIPVKFRAPCRFACGRSRRGRARANRPGVRSRTARTISLKKRSACSPSRSSQRCDKLLVADEMGAGAEPGDGIVDKRRGEGRRFLVNPEDHHVEDRFDAERSFLDKIDSALEFVADEEIAPAQAPSRRDREPEQICRSRPTATAVASVNMRWPQLRNFAILVECGEHARSETDAG